MYEVHRVETKVEFDAIIRMEWRAYHEPYRSEHHILSVATYASYTSCSAEYQFLHPVWGSTDEEREQSLKYDQDRLWEKRLENPFSHWIYVKESSTGQIAGAAEWLIYTENPFPNGPQRIEATWWPPGEAKDFATEMINQMYAPRQNWMQRPFVGEHILAAR